MIPSVSQRTPELRHLEFECCPVNSYNSLYGNEKMSFLYESLESNGERGRYSFFGGRPFLRITWKNGICTVSDSTQNHTVSENPFSVMKKIIGSFPCVTDIPVFTGGAVGFCSYDTVRLFEKIPDTGKDTFDLPDLEFIFPEEITVVDHHRKTTDIILYSEKKDFSRIEMGLEKGPVINTPVSSSDFRALSDKQEFCDMVKNAKEYLLSGDIFQVVLSQRFSFKSECHSFDIYKNLRLFNPSPYMYFLNFTDYSILGSSPETLVSLEKDNIYTRPLAGTRPRGKTPDDDVSLEKELLADQKERAEHLMLVDLARNDVGRISEYGSVQVSDLFSIEKYSRVMHIVSSVTGKLKHGLDAFDVFASCFPAGTVSGAPKVRAMEIIDELERFRRGPYAGAIGYFSFSGSMDVCIAIRMILMLKGNGFIQAGAGIVYDSVPENEFQETVNKAAAMVKAAGAGL